jgi:hypothetical protein
MRGGAVRAIGSRLQMRHTRRRSRSRPGRRKRGQFLGGAVTGAVLAWLLDPHQGHHRRRLLVDRAAASVRRSSRRLGRLVRTRAARAEGQTRGLVHRLQRQTSEPPDDATLAHKVESVVFRDARFPKGQVSVNAEQGEVFLRGQVDPPELIRELEEAVRKVPGVRAVENLLHEPGTPAPAPHAGRRVGRARPG